MPSVQEITQQQRALWSSAAAGWERSGDWFENNSGGLTEWLCDAAAMRAGMHVLDVACGSGNPSTTAAQRVRPGGHVVATDLSPDMVAVTQRKAQRLGLDNIEVREMDAQALAFPDCTFDAATCRFGLMFPPDPIRAAGEIRRVLKPGARFATASWDVPAKNPFFTSTASVVAEFVPTPPPDPTAPGPFRLAPPGELARVLTEAGFSEVRVEPRPIVLTYDSLEDYWRVSTDLASPLRTALASLSPDDVARLKARLFEAVAPQMVGSAVKLAAVPLCASATRRS
jgi:SAM-dependent methyltransferase